MSVSFLSNIRPRARALLGLLGLAASSMLVLYGCGTADEGAQKADPALGGWYAERTRIGNLQLVPGAEPYSTLSSFFMVTKLTVDRGRAFIEEHFCHSEMTGGPIQVLIPDAFTQSISAPVVELRVREENGVQIYSHPGHPLPVGVKLQDPEREPLPTDPSDPRIWDQDADGKPGVTAYVPGGNKTEEIYVIRKERYTFDFKQSAPGRYQGPFVDLAEQVVIGASTPILDFTPGVKPDPAVQSDIELVKMSAAVDAMPSCDTMMRAADTVFSP